MGIVSFIRGALENPCQHLVSYQSRTFTFHSVKGEFSGATVSFGGFSTHVEKIRETGDLVNSLDTWQYHFCCAIQRLNKRRRQRYLEAHIGALGIIGNLQFSLLAFKANPDGEKESLDDAVRTMQDFMKRVAVSSLKLLSPSRESRALSAYRKALPSEERVLPAPGEHETASRAPPPAPSPAEPSPSRSAPADASQIRNFLWSRANTESDRPYAEAVSGTKASPTTNSRTITAVLKQRAMKNALKFAGLKQVEVRELAKQFSAK